MRVVEARWCSLGGGGGGLSGRVRRWWSENDAFRIQGRLLERRRSSLSLFGCDLVARGWGWRVAVGLLWRRWGCWWHQAGRLEIGRFLGACCWV